MTQVIDKSLAGSNENMVRLPRIAQAAEAELRSAPYQEIRGLRCTAKGDAVRIQGRVGSYFLKQIAQELVQQVVRGICLLENRVEVR